jgi:uncharacterized membrane protein
MLTTVMTVHIVAGALGLLCGFAALFASKGSAAHRASGRLFVYSMVTMALLGAGIAAVWGRAAATNVPAGLLTAYLVVTALTTVAPPRAGAGAFALALMLVAVGVCASMSWFGAGAIARGGRGVWMAIPAFTFAAIAALGTAGDFRVLRSGPLFGGRRLARHLWRMSTALAIASLSFSVRLPRLLPPALRSPIVYALPTLLVLGTMFYWLWRMRSKRASRNHAILSSGAATGAMARSNAGMFEFARHRSNGRMSTILSGARAAERP